MGCKEITRERVVLIPYPAQGHVTPMIQLAAAFHRKGFEPLIITPNFIHEHLVMSRKEDDDNQEGLVFVPLPDGLAENEPRNFFTIRLAMENTMPRHLHRMLGALRNEQVAAAAGAGRVACVVVDLLASWAIDVATSHDIPVAGFWPAMHATYNLVSAIPHMIQAGFISETGSPVRKGAVRFLPGQPMLGTDDLPWLVGNPAQRISRFQFWLQTLRRSKSLRWLLINSFPNEDRNHHQVQQITPATKSAHFNPPSHFHVGPLTRHTKTNPSLWVEDKSCLEWLDKQTPRSVVYVSFGSWVGPIGEAQIAELALGLEATQKPFLWVLGHEWRAGLPAGYEEQVAVRGKVVTWAPQKEVLQHGAVGCFLTHCGWNSTVEAIVGGKPLLCYPLAGDQFVNSTYIAEVWGIGVRMGGMERREVEERVREVTELGGGEMGRRVVELKERIMGEEDDSANLNAFLECLKKSGHLGGGESLSSCVGDGRANAAMSRPGGRENAIIHACIG
ncbi:hypothetical protein ACLOJK_031692 [Asimina triloba]